MVIKFGGLRQQHYRERRGGASVRPETRAPHRANCWENCRSAVFCFQGGLGSPGSLPASPHTLTDRDPGIYSCGDAGNETCRCLENASSNPVWEPCVLGGSGIRLEREEKARGRKQGSLYQKMDLKSPLWTVTFPKRIVFCVCPSPLTPVHSLLGRDSTSTWLK